MQVLLCEKSLAYYYPAAGIYQADIRQSGRAAGQGAERGVLGEHPGCSASQAWAAGFTGFIHCIVAANRNVAGPQIRRFTNMWEEK